jgi:tripartite-type tricarboxylate transporter receptor subunit TctC
MRKLAVLALGLALASIHPAVAQEWPQKAVRVIVPFAPGSSPDILARVVSDRLNKNLNQPFIVENKPGAGGMIGTDAIAKSPADGYTIGVSITGPLVNNTLLYKTMAYDPFKDLAPITQAVNQPCMLVVSKDFKATNAQEMIAELKRNPGKYNYASFGNGTVAHLAMELIAARSGTQIVQVAYPGAQQVIAAMLAGDVSMGCIPAAGAMPQVKAGKLTAIGVASKNRSSLFPEVPTLAEQGLSGVEANSWIGWVAPAKTPPPVLGRIRTEIVRVLKDPEVVKALHNQLMEPVGNTPEEFAAYMREELDRWGPIIKQNKITLD